ncbi:acyl-CoA-binding protein [Ferrimonas pelagia]|uniref:Acyl-CoA-binding protein n=1 Tax=Ferrimonas pelagia TaxID=1177826 RepID=A0ABP9EFB8_9GAMM
MEAEAEIVSRFEQAKQQIEQWHTRPTNDQLLALYGSYKQATVGDVLGKRPGLFDFQAGAKYAAWEEHKGQSAEEAMANYIATVERITQG